MSKLPIIKQRRAVAQSRLFQIEALSLTFSNGTETEYERLMPSGFGAVIVCALRSDGQVLLICEYSAGTHRYELGLPKGRMESGEDPLEAANRELAEETGFAARQLTLLNKLSIAPAYMSHATHLVLAEDLYPQTAEGDEPEPIEVVPWSLNDIYALSERDDCSEARTLAALYLAKDFINGRES